MKKTSKIFGAIALSATLALGCAAPAFADITNNTAVTDKTVIADETTLDQADATNAGKTATQIDVDTYTSQLNVTLPLTIAVAADTAGGEGMSPSNYYIENNSRATVSIVSASVAQSTDSQTLWELTNDNTKLGGTASPDLSTATLGYINVTLLPEKLVDKKNNAGDAITGATKVSIADANTSLNNWIITSASDTNNYGDYATKGNGRKMLIKVDTQSSQLKRAMTSTDEGTLATVSYTVKAGSAATA